MKNRVFVQGNITRILPLLSAVILLLTWQNARAQCDGIAIPDSLLDLGISQGIPGIQVIFGDSRSNCIQAKGYADKDALLEFNDSNIWRIGSISKLMTAVVILQLEAEGKLKLSDRLSKYIELKDSALDRISILHLLTHSSGLFNYTEDRKFRKARNRGDSISIRECFEYGLNHSPNDTGKFAYSNSDYAALGLIIHSVTGKSLEEVFQERIFLPAGMQNASYCLGDADLKNLVPGYDLKKRRAKRRSHGSLSWANAAGGVGCTLTDLAKFSDALFSKRLLDSAELNKLITLRKPIGGSESMAVGLGCFHFIDSSNSVQAIFHDGSLPGYSLLYVYLPESKKTCVIAFNASGRDKKQMERIMNSIFKWVLSSHYVDLN